MSDSISRWEPSELALQRQRAALPTLLLAVRRRRWRRRAVRAGTAGILVLAVAWLVHGASGERPAGEPPAVVRTNDAALVASLGRCTLVVDDPTVLARCEVATTVRPEWFIDDAGLQGLLRALDRPAGLVCVGTRVQVTASAVDAWGSELP